MRWKGERQSSNVDDRRRGGSMRRAGTLGGGALVVLLLAMLFGVDPSRLLEGLGDGGAGVQATERPLTAEDEEIGAFASVVLASTEDVWRAQFAERGDTYRDARMVLFRGIVSTACGTQHSHVGPFYCPGDHSVYLDTGFFETLANRLGARGDFAQAYVIAHEVGHHVQNLLGYSERVHALRGRVSEEEFNRASVRLELQADFLAGVWAHHAQEMRGILEAGDVEEAMGAAAAVGDDKLQRESTGTVRPETFTHGTSEQRVRAFELGFRTGDLARAAEFFR